MEKSDWERVWAANEAARAAEAYTASGEIVPANLERQFEDGLEAVDLAYQALRSRLDNLPDQPAASAALYEALQSSPTGETESSVCWRAIARVRGQPEPEPKLPKTIEIDWERSSRPTYGPDDPALFARSRSEDEAERTEAQTELVKRYGDFVRFKARKLYWRLPRVAGVGYDDLEQEGMLGLFRAAELYVPAESKFLTYATSHITQRMKLHYKNMKSTVRIPVGIQSKLDRVKYANDWRWNRHLSPLRLQEIAELADVEPHLSVHRSNSSTTVGNLLEVELLSGYMGSIDGGFSPREMGPGNDYILDERTGMENLTYRNDPVDIADGAIRTTLRSLMESVLSTLPAREREILSLRFGWADGKVRSSEEVGREFGVTRERVRFVEAYVLAKLRHPDRSIGLRSFAYGEGPHY